MLLQQKYSFSNSYFIMIKVEVRGNTSGRVKRKFKDTKNVSLPFSRNREE